MSPEHGLLLAPGAGASSESLALVAVEEALGDAFAVRRMDFPYRLAGKRAPDRMPVLLASVQEQMERFSEDAGMPPERIFVGGRSMGGRVFSVAVAEGMQSAGLVLMSYPLHPPGKPDKLRVEHFPDITVPVLLVSGTRDTFGTPQELEEHSKAIPGPVTHEWVDGGGGGGDHGMKKHDATVATIVSAWLPQ